MRVGGLFSGVGGLALGLERAGMESVFEAEILPASRAVIARHFPNTRLVGDVRHVGTHHPFSTCPPECEEGCVHDELECIGVSELADDYQIDVLAGGFPCQDISSAGDRWGNRKGTDGERSGLWWEFARVIEVAEPRWVIIENTGRLRNGRDGADLRAVVEELDRRAYVGIGLILDVAAFGLPARRPRAFLVARRANGAVSGLPGARRLADRFLRDDPGCVVFEGPGQSRAAHNGPARPA